jgi:glycosyltransferase involved in cell wall biosynthesis
MSDRPRVLFIAPQPFFQWRGSPIRVGFNVQALADLGFEVDLLTLPIGEERLLPGVRVLRVANPLGVKNVPIGPSAHKAFFDLLILFKALSLARRRRYAVIHAVEETGLIGWLAARLTGARVVFEKHSDPASHKDKPFKNLVLACYRQVEHLAIRAADAVIATGEGLVAQVRAVAPGKAVHGIFDIPSSLVEPTPARTEAARARVQQAPDEVLALYVGSFAVYQGLELLFESLPAATQRCPHLRVLIVGGTEAEIDARRAWLRSRGIEDRVRFLGRIPPDELPDYLAASDLLLSPRLAGINTPLKLLDYLKAARAILATDNTANRQILDETCAVLTASEPAAFADGMARLADDAALRERLGRAGRRLIDEKYNFGEFKRRLAACYRGLGITF